MNYSLHVIQANIWTPLVKPPWRCHLLPKAGCEEEKQKASSFHLRSFLWIFHQWMHYSASLINWFGQFWGQTPPQNCTWSFPTAAKKNFFLKWVILKTLVLPRCNKMLLTIVLVFEIVSLATSIVTFATAHCIVVNHCVECFRSCYLNQWFDKFWIYFSLALSTSWVLVSTNNHCCHC